VRFSLEVKLALAVAVLLVVPGLLAGAIVMTLYARGIFGGPSSLAWTLAAGLAALTAYAAATVWALARHFVGRLRAIQVGTELMATVDPHYRLPLTGGDELNPLAEEINRLADRLRDARIDLQAQVTQATRELDEEHGRLVTVLETLGEGVVLAGVDGAVILANRVAHEQLGGAPGGLLARNLFDFVDREKVIYFVERLRQGAQIQRFSLLADRDATLAAVMTPFFDADGSMRGFVVILRDVTGPARAEEERRRRLTETLRGLRDPLASIRSLSESLLTQPAELASEFRRLVEAINLEAVRLSGLVSERRAHEDFGLEAAPTHFEEISADDVVAMALRRAAQEGVETGGIVVVPPRAGAALHAEASMLTAALAHLMQGVLLRRLPGGRAWLRSRSVGHVVQFEVSAEGRGVITELDAGLDLPLMVGVASVLSVREVVRRHSGEVWSYAAEGRLGYRLTCPAAGGGGSDRDRARHSPAFVGAGTVSGWTTAGPAPARPALYDFSLLEELERSVRADDRARPLRELTYAVFDTETTGLSPQHGDRVVSMAAVRVRAGVVRAAEYFDALVNPARPIPSASVRFHGITDAMVAEAPPIEVVLPAFLRFAEGCVLVGHQVWFDLLFLKTTTIRQPVLDTVALAEMVYGRLDDFDLGAVAGRLGVAVRGRHSALGDALATAEILVRLIGLLDKRGVRTLGDALDVTRRARAAAGR
jgi:DNA polymerase-3 subunit epsilon